MKYMTTTRGKSSPKSTLGSFHANENGAPETSLLATPEANPLDEAVRRVDAAVEAEVSASVLAYFSEDENERVPKTIIFRNEDGYMELADVQDAAGDSIYDGLNDMELNGEVTGVFGKHSESDQRSWEHSFSVTHPDSSAATDIDEAVRQVDTIVEAEVGASVQAYFSEDEDGRIPHTVIFRKEDDYMELADVLDADGESIYDGFDDMELNGEVTGVFGKHSEANDNWEHSFKIS